MYSAYNLNKQGDNIQPLLTSFLIWNQSALPCSVLTIASWSAYRFLRRQARWSGMPISVSFPQFVVIHTVKCFYVVNKAEVGVFLEISCFFYDPTNVDNLISGSSAFSKSSLNIWKFTASRILSIILLFCEMSAIVREYEHSLALPFFGIGMKTDLFQAAVTVEFSKFAGILSATL